MNKTLLLCALLGLAACDSSATNVVLGTPHSILVEVGGGIAAADYAYMVDADGAVVGVRCRSLCDFAAGDTLHVLTELQTDALERRLSEAGAWALEGTHDYGVPCCDQFEYRLTFSDDEHQGVVRGTGESLPEELVAVVALLDELRRGIAPLVEEEAVPPGGPASDPVDIVGARLEAPVLTLDVRYGGGCARHGFDLVLRSGWRESYPVQVDVDLAHDAHADPCDAIVQGELRFDLTPLRNAYVAAYGTGPGAVTLFVGAAAGGERTAVTWSF